MYVFLNNKIVRESDAKVSVYDHGFLYGDGVYETMRSYDDTVFMLDGHMKRLRRSASLIRLKLPEGRFIRGAVYKALEANRLSNAYIRITVSRGKGPIGLDPDLCGEPTLVVIAEEFREYPEAYYKKGTRLIMAKTRRNPMEALNPEIKSLNFLNNILAKMEAKETDAQEAIMLNTDGFIAEGTVSNIFFVKDGMLCTPSLDAGILDGVTRKLVIGLAKTKGMKVKEGLFCTKDALKASEVFFTNTTSEIMPVSRIDDTEFRVGKITGALHKSYKEKVAEYIRRNRPKNKIKDYKL